MKLIKRTITAGTVALAVSAFIGPASALATPLHPWYALCNAQQLLLCETSHLIKHPLLGSLILLLAGPGEFSAGFVSVKCEKGMGETNKIDSQQLNELRATLESLAFRECTGCSSVTVTAPQSAAVYMEAEGFDTWRLEALHTKVKFSGCPLGITCKYEGSLNLKVQMNESGAFVDPENASFSKVEGNAFCAGIGIWVSGRTTFDWVLDEILGGVVHKNIWPSLIEKLTKTW